MQGARLSFPEPEKKSLARSYERTAIKKFPQKKETVWDSRAAYAVKEPLKKRKVWDL